ncbi:MAG TPA: hemolysin family protein, partial [Bryobacteraceae bacterium]|nr:hemolysin family protein [Bryobacteraceae bacterium]
MSAILIAAALLLGVVLAAVTLVQQLYQESLRLRPHERPALEYFKEKLQARIGVDTDHGVLTFSLVKHTLLVLLGVVILLLHRSPGSLRSVIESCLLAWVTMLGATYIVPHVLYRRSSGRWLGAFAPLLGAVAYLMRPLVAVSAFFQSLTELTNGEPEEKEAATPAENIEALITAGTEEGLIEESDRELIQSVVEFGDKTVREVMTPRPNIVAVAADQSLEKLRQLVITEQYSRIPVYEDGIDRIIGFVHVRDMFELDEDERQGRTVRELLRPIRFVPETKPVNDLLKEMQQDRAHMAIVVDEYGNTAGLVTLEDLVEEVFGEIQDEHEPVEDVVEDGPGRYIVSG